MEDNTQRADGYDAACAIIENGWPEAAWARNAPQQEIDRLAPHRRFLETAANLPSSPDEARQFMRAFRARTAGSR